MLSSFFSTSLFLCKTHTSRRISTQVWRLIHSWLGWQSQTVKSRVINAFTHPRVHHKPGETQRRSRVINSQNAVFTDSLMWPAVLHAHWADPAREYCGGAHFTFLVLEKRAVQSTQFIQLWKLTVTYKWCLTFDTFVMLIWSCLTGSSSTKCMADGAWDTSTQTWLTRNNSGCFF